MVAELVRSEKPALKNLDETLEAITRTTDTNELATLFLLANELYADSQCLCEEKAAVVGEEADEAIMCQRHVNVGRDKILDTYKTVIKQLKGGG